MIQRGCTVRFSEEGIRCLIPSRPLRGVVTAVQDGQVEVTDWQGKTESYHPDFLEVVTTPRKLFADEVRREEKRIHDVDGCDDPSCMACNGIGFCDNRVPRVTNLACRKCNGTGKEVSHMRGKKSKPLQVR